MSYHRRRSDTLCGVAVHGDDAFLRRTAEALALLEPLAQYELIHTHLAVIRQGKRSGVTAWTEHPVFTVGAPTWSHSPLWYAGAIAHDAYHAKLYRDAKKRNRGRRPPVDSWSGKAAERCCLRFQRDVLVRLKADPIILEHLETHLKNPTYQGRSKGRGGWLDYHKRWW